MVKKQIRLTKETLNKNQSYIPSGLDKLINEVKNNGNSGKLVHMNFEVPQELRNSFKAKAAKQGKNIKNVLVDFMSEYVRD